MWERGRKRSRNKRINHRERLEIKVKKVLGYYNYTVVLTYLGMVLAFFGILELIFPLPHLGRATLCLLAAGLCDMFDGTVAATKNLDAAVKRCGIQIDSLSDLVGFGVLPGIFVYVALERRAWVGLISAAYVLCALIRLAYFNVLEEERQNMTAEKRTVYLGVPVTTIALLLPGAFLFCKWVLQGNMYPLAGLLALVAVCFITPVEVKKPGMKGKIIMLMIGLLLAAAIIATLCIMRRHRL